MASLKIAVDSANLLKVLNALNAATIDELEEMWYAIKDPSNPAHQLIKEYNAYQALVNAPMPMKEELQ